MLEDRTNKWACANAPFAVLEESLKSEPIGWRGSDKRRADRVAMLEDRTNEWARANEPFAEFGVSWKTVRIEPSA